MKDALTVIQISGFTPIRCLTSGSISGFIPGKMNITGHVHNFKILGSSTPSHEDIRELADSMMTVTPVEHYPTTAEEIAKLIDEED